MVEHNLLWLEVVRMWLSEVLAFFSSAITFFSKSTSSFLVKLGILLNVIFSFLKPLLSISVL